VATYSTDLTTLTTAESGTWVEFASPYDAAGSPSADGENFIQGVDCISQTTGKADGLVISIAFDYGSGYSFGTDEVVIAWCFYAVGVNLQTYANGGWRFGIASTTADINVYDIGGSDYGRNPYGGWINVAVDPTLTADHTVGGGNGGTYRYFGSIPYTIAEISKGTPSAMDAVRVGRGELSITGSGGSFSELASYNDWNSTATPPGTSSTVKDSGYHRLGLFQEQGGTYLWKGLLSFGITATSITFSDSNETIIIEDTAKTYTAFNKVEVNNASSSVTMTNVTFISTGTIAPGQFEMVDNATVILTGCAFNSMNTFILQSNAVLSGCTFNGCGQLTVDSASISGGAFNSCDPVYCSTVAMTASIQGVTFSSSGTGHGLNIGDGSTILSTTSVTLSDLIFSGYDTDDPGTATNKAIHVNSASGGGTITLNISGGSGITDVAHIRATNCTVVVSADVTVTFTGMKDNTEVRVYATSDGSEIAGIENATAGTTDNRSFAWSSPSATSVYYVIHHWSGTEPFYLTIRKEGYIVPATNTNVEINQTINRNAE